MFTFVRTVHTIGLAIALPRHWNAFQILTLKLIMKTASMFYKHKNKLELFFKHLCAPFMAPTHYNLSHRN